MDKPLRIIILYIGLCFLPHLIFAQISEGGTPPSFEYENIKLRSSGNAPVHEILVPFTIEDLKAEDAILDNGVRPPRVSSLLPVGLGMSNAGEWTQLSNGSRVWRLHLSARGAIATMVYYNKFFIPKGAQLYLYNNDRTHILGAYTYKNNPESKRFCTEFIAGDNFWLEYVASTESDELPEIEIENIGYGYNNLQIRASGLNTSGSCMVDINCEEGNDWQIQKRGVCQSIFTIGTSAYTCTGALLNNTKQDFTPYILTAHHCVSEGKGTLDYNQSLFYFNYEKTGCGNNVLATKKTMVGCELRAYSPLKGGSDGLLLELKNDIPNSYRPYFNGWDRRNIAPSSGVGIHHPSGDVKKISTYTTPAIDATWDDGTNKGAARMHWDVTFRATKHGHSITEGGSSGSPLYNKNKLVVGTLTGGNSDCATFPLGSNQYGKLYAHWDKYGSETKNNFMSVYLDPQNTGKETLEGLDGGVLYPEPQQVTASADNTRKQIIVRWNVPIEGTPSKYIVYRNNVAIDTVENRVQSYVDNTLPNGGYVYSVSALYGSEPSKMKNADKCQLETYLVPQNAHAFSLEPGNIRINWEKPVYRQFLHWSNMDPHLTISFQQSDLSTAYAGHIWAKEDIKDLDKQTVESVSFVPLPNVKYSIYIKQGNHIYNEDVTQILPTDINKVTLKKPFVIDASKDLIVAIKVSNPASNLPIFVIDNLPAIESKGNLISLDGENWKSLAIKDMESRNFVLGMTVSSATGEITTTTSSIARTVPKSFTELQASPAPFTANKLRTTSDQIIVLPYSIPTISGYKVYRNDRLISPDNYSLPYFVDTNIEALTPYRYTIKCDYSNLLSDVSDVTIASDAALYINDTKQTPDFTTGKYSFIMPCDNRNLNIKTQSASTGAYNEINGERHPLSTSVPITNNSEITIIVRSGNGEIENTYRLYVAVLTDKECNDTEIKSLIINDQNFSYSPQNVPNYEAVTDCHANVIHLQLTAPDRAKIEIDGTQTSEHIYSFPTNETEKTMAITVTSPNREQTTHYRLTVRRLSKDIIIQRWNDVLSLYTGAENTASLNITKYEWYRNGVLLPEKTQPYIQIDPVTDATAIYTVCLTVDNAIKLYSCEKSLTANLNRINLYPNHMKAGEEITIVTSGAETEQTSISIFSPSGNLERSILTAQRKTVLAAPEIPGSYIVRVQVAEGYTKEFKIIVE